MVRKKVNGESQRCVKTTDFFSDSASGHGGARAGSGRKKVYDEQKKVLPARVDKACRVKVASRAKKWNVTQGAVVEYAVSCLPDDTNPFEEN